MSDPNQANAINWDEVVEWTQTSKDPQAKNIWPKLSEEERVQFLGALKKRQENFDITKRPDSAVIGMNGRPMLNPEDILSGLGIVRGVKGILGRGGPQKAGIGRVPTEGGGMVEKSGLPAKIKVNSNKQATGPGVPKSYGDTPNLHRMGNTSFSETEKRAAMFGGAKPAGQAVKPNMRTPTSVADEAAALEREIMKGKTGGSLPNDAPRGTIAGKAKPKKPVTRRKPK